MAVCPGGRCFSSNKIFQIQIKIVLPSGRLLLTDILSMKILFIQLPLLDHTQGYLLGNFEYAPASLAAYIRKQFPGRVETHLLPRNLSLFASDSVILRYFKNMAPDAVSFTCYLWNIERSLSLAEKMKKALGSCEIFFGGPEIAQGSIALNSPNPHVDCFVSGEGEWFFDIFLRGGDWKKSAVTHEGNTVMFQPDDALLDARDDRRAFYRGIPQSHARRVDFP